jgi:hypothetical protein
MHSTLGDRLNDWNLPTTCIPASGRLPASHLPHNAMTTTHTVPENMPVTLQLRPATRRLFL